MFSLNVGEYALAHNLIGFPCSTLRVKVTRLEGEYVWVTTADLLSAGVPLTLDVKQVESEEEQAWAACVNAEYAHKDSLV